MTRKLAFVVLAGLVVTLAFTPSALAQDTTGAAEPGGIAKGLGFLAAGLGMALAAGLCGLGQSKAIVAACEGIARNPGAQGAIRLTMILGLAFIESLTLFTLVIVFAKL